MSRTQQLIFRAGMALWAILAPVSGLPQVRTAVLQGQVRDRDTGEGLGWTSILLVELGRSATAHEDGRFEISNVPPGTYTLRAFRIGYENTSVRVEVRPPRTDLIAGSLSGGNQQKVVLAKWLAANLKVLLLDEPTRGIDVGAKAEIHGLIDELAHRGMAILLISSELPEVLAMSDRIYVMRERRIVAELSHEEATQEVVIRYATAADHANQAVGCTE
jgi:hypothetical protein